MTRTQATVSLALLASLAIGCPSNKKPTALASTPVNVEAADEAEATATEPGETDDAITLAAFTITFEKADDNPDGPSSLTMSDTGEIRADGKVAGMLSTQGVLTIQGEDGVDTELLRLGIDGTVKIDVKGGDAVETISVGADGSVSMKGEAGISFGDDGTVTLKDDSAIIKYDGPSEARRAAALVLLAMML